MRVGLFAAALAVAGCAAPPGCPLTAQTRMLAADLYFGRDVSGGAAVGDAAWDAFVAGDLMARFPDGLTVIDAAGRWRDPRTGRAVSEATKVVRIVLPAGPAAAARIAAAAEEYRRRFRQSSVGIVTAPVCAAF